MILFLELQVKESGVRFDVAFWRRSHDSETFVDHSDTLRVKYTVNVWTLVIEHILGFSQ